MPALLVDSIKGQVLDSVCEAIRAMTIAGGYHWDVQEDSVQTDPVNVLGVGSDRRPFFLIEASPTGTREWEAPGGLVNALRILITAIVDAEGDSPDRKTAACLALEMDLERALLVDITRGGLCSDTRLQEPEEHTALGTGNTAVIVQELECRIHRTYGAP